MELEQPINKKVLLYSGGMDSFLCDFFWHPDIRLYCSIHHRYQKKEIEVMDCIGLPYIKDEHIYLADKERDDAIIPLRNLFLIMAASFYGDNIAVGVLKGEINGDKSLYFKNKTQQVLNKCYEASYWSQGRKITIEYPIAGFTKAESVHEYLKQGGDKDLLLRTWSCYSSGKIHCGWCSNCVKRYIALELNNISDAYQNDPHKSPYLKEIKKRLDTFSSIRKKETLLIFNKECGK